MHNTSFLSVSPDGWYKLKILERGTSLLSEVRQNPSRLNLYINKLMEFLMQLEKEVPTRKTSD